MNRSLLYFIGKLWGDINAVRKGKVKRRVKRRIAGKLFGRLMGKIK